MRTIKRIAICILALCMLLSVAACSKKQERRVIGSAVDCEIYEDELRFVTLTYKDELAARYGADIWDTPESAEQYRAELESIVWDEMRNHYAVLLACRNYGYAVSELENQNIQAAVDEQIEEAIDALGGKEEFAAALAESYMTEELLRFSLAVEQMENELRYALIDAGLIEGETDAFMSWLENGNAVYVQHILIRNDEGDDPAANRAHAESLRAQLISGEATIDELVKYAASNEDVSNPDAYYVVRDVYDETMETAVFALQNVGDVSEVVEAKNGYYVFVRRPETIEDGANLTLMGKVDALLYSYQWTKVEDYVQEQRDKVQFELNDFGKSIDLLAIK